MPELGLIPGWSVFHGTDTTASQGTAATATVANTLGNYTVIYADTTQDQVVEWNDWGVTITLNEDSNSACDYLVSVKDQVGDCMLVEKLLYCNTNNSKRVATYFFPVVSPTSYKFACQADNVSGGDKSVNGIVSNGSFMGIEMGTKIKTYGANASDSGGTSIDPGGSAHTKGSYVEFIASTPYDIKGLVVAFGGQLNTAPSSGSWLVDVGVGGAGSEKVVVPNLLVVCDATAKDLSPQNTMFIPVYIPSGSRVSVRAQSSITDATDRLIDVILYAVM